MRHPLLILLFLPLLAAAQEPVAPVTGWLATVDEASQQIVLRWHPSADSAASGYHICSGTPCLDYDTVFGRLDTTYVCLDHSALEQHTYRIHVFDTAHNVSSLTPSFGNMVLQAEIPECATSVSARWTPYPGMPDGVSQYRLLARLEPFDDDYSVVYSTDTNGPLAYNFEMPDDVTHAHLMVEARGGDLTSHSNIVSVERRTVDTAAFVEITSIAYDSLNNAIVLRFHIDTAYHGADHYTLWRSIDGDPWRVLATGIWQEYTDRDINRYDSLYCYQLSVYDACGINEKFSSTVWTVVPDPPEPGVAFPNIIIAGDPDNGHFLPRTESLSGELYELTVYDRHGLQVFSSTDPAAAWTPSPYNPQGAYVYALHVKFINGIKQTYVGTFLVIK